MSMPNSPGNSPESDYELWQLMLREMQAIPKRYELARENQRYAVGLMSGSPLGFTEDTTGELGADRILQHDIEFIKLCFLSLRGALTLSLDNLPQAERSLQTADIGRVNSFDHNPLNKGWRITLVSGNIANVSVEMLQEAIEYKP